MQQNTEEKQHLAKRRERRAGQGQAPGAVLRVLFTFSPLPTQPQERVASPALLEKEEEAEAATGESPGPARRDKHALAARLRAGEVELQRGWGRSDSASHLEKSSPPGLRL